MISNLCCTKKDDRIHKRAVPAEDLPVFIYNEDTEETNDEQKCTYYHYCDTDSDRIALCGQDRRCGGKDQQFYRCTDAGDPGHRGDWHDQLCRIPVSQ